MQIHSIYKATNKISGKSYIGYTSKPLKNRQYGHKTRVKTGSNDRFYNAIRKYGWHSFDWEIICQSLDGEYLLKEMEPYFIQYYNTFENGYNMTKGGEGTFGAHHSSETKRKIVSNRCSMSGKSNPMYGKHHSKETIEKIRQTSLGRKHDKNSSHKMRQKALGRKHSEETRIKIGIANANRPIKKWLKTIAPFPTFYLFDQLSASILSSL